MNQLRFIRKRHEYGDVWTFMFARVGRVEFEAGQYTHLALGGQGNYELRRELSFASAPADKEVWFCVHVRAGSPFKQRLAALQPGALVELHHTQGRMVAPQHNETAVVLVGQGIAAAPLRSLLRAGQTNPVALLHVGRSAYVYETELRQLTSHYERVQRETLTGRLQQLRIGHTAAQFYIAGSPPFVAQLALQLQNLGVAYGDLRTTMFDAYNDRTI